MIGNHKFIRFNPLLSVSSVLLIIVAPRRRRKSLGFVFKNKQSVFHQGLGRLYLIGAAGSGFNTTPFVFIKFMASCTARSS